MQSVTVEGIELWKIISLIRDPGIAWCRSCNLVNPGGDDRCVLRGPFYPFCPGVHKNCWKLGQFMLFHTRIFQISFYWYSFILWLEDFLPFLHATSEAGAGVTSWYEQGSGFSMSLNYIFSSLKWSICRDIQTNAKQAGVSAKLYCVGC